MTASYPNYQQFLALARNKAYFGEYFIDEHGREYMCHDPRVHTPRVSAYIASAIDGGDDPGWTPSLEYAEHRPRQRRAPGPSVFNARLLDKLQLHADSVEMLRAAGHVRPELHRLWVCARGKRGHAANARARRVDPDATLSVPEEGERITLWYAVPRASGTLVRTKSLFASIIVMWSEGGEQGHIAQRCGVIEWHDALPIRAA